MSDEVSIDQFHTVPAFKGLTPADLDVVNSIIYSVALKPGQALFKEGDHGDGMYLIISGNVEVSKQVDEGSRWQIAQHGPGICFGEMALLWKPNARGHVHGVGTHVAAEAPLQGIQRTVETKQYCRA